MSALLASLMALGIGAAPSEKVVEQFEDCTYTYTGGDYKDEAFHYRLLKPAKIEPGKKYPVVLFLHGAGERGDDNKSQLLYLPEMMADKEHQEKYPCFLIAPQCREGKVWSGFRRASKAGDSADEPTDQLKVAIAALKEVEQKSPIDPKRVYLTGLSMGGYGSWDLAARHPDWFAAVVPICGGGDVSTAGKLKDIPLWAVHGGADTVVPVDQTRKMIEAVKKAGGQPKYSELEGVGHNSWTPGYTDPKGALPWMFEQVNERQKAGA
jgi:predicted peptidase